MRSLGGVSDDLKIALVSDYRIAPISEIDRCVLEFVEALTLRPQDVSKEKVQALRDRGMDDRTLHDIVQVTAYFNYVNRIADGLGVEVES